MIEFGEGDVSMSTGKRADVRYPDELIFAQGPRGAIGREDRELIGASTNDIKPACRLVFHKIESLDVLLERLTFLRGEMASGLGADEAYLGPWNWLRRALSVKNFQRLSKQVGDGVIRVRRESSGK